MPRGQAAPIEATFEKTSPAIRVFSGCAEVFGVECLLEVDDEGRCALHWVAAQVPETGRVGPSAFARETENARPDS